MGTGSSPLLPRSALFWLRATKNATTVRSRQGHADNLDGGDV